MAASARIRPVTRRQFLLTLGGAGASYAVANLLWPFGEDGPPGADGLQAVERAGFALGATTSIVALHEDYATAQRAVEAAFAELRTVEAVMSLYRPDSQLCRLNRERILLEPHPYLVEVLDKAQAMSAASGGDFDVTVQPLWTLYAAAMSNGHLPNVHDIERTRRLVDWRRVEMDRRAIHLKGSGTAATLNGIAQGFAADRALGALAAGGVRHALVNTGEIGAIGRRRDGGFWTIGIQHPRHQDAFISRAHLDGRCVATSGDYGTAFSPDRVHNHIFDPCTGRSPKEFQSVTVLAKTGLEADALSTTVFVTGLERGIDLIESTPGADALFVLKSGETKVTNGFPGGDTYS
ncbi:MAG: FAD:protein FMN transferase [Planctomycetota bacterium]|jgi:thiamine biosynthesis lipoprotein